MEASKNNEKLTIWAMTSGAAGMRSQVLGLSNALGGNIIEKQIYLKPFWRIFPGHLSPFPMQGLTSKSSSLSEPWPDVLITCGRRTSAISIAIGKASNGKTYRVHIQDPRTPSQYYNLVAAMNHDPIKGNNVIYCKTALHKLTKSDLDKARNVWQEKLKGQSDKPVLGIILGGKNKNFGFDQPRIEDLISLIKNAVETNYRVLITPSRRTEQFVKSALEDLSANNQDIWLWNETGDNPYLAILSLADHLCVTSDSVSMISEALYTGKPVHIFPLSGISRRHNIFLNILQDDGSIWISNNKIDFSVHAHNQPIDETAKVADIIRQNIARAPK